MRPLNCAGTNARRTWPPLSAAGRDGSHPTPATALGWVVAGAQGPTSGAPQPLRPQDSPARRGHARGGFRVLLPHGRSNTADQLRSGAPVRLAGGGTGRHLSLQYGCRPELRQLHPLVRWPSTLADGLLVSVPATPESFLLRPIRRVLMPLVSGAGQGSATPLAPRRGRTQSRSLRATLPLDRSVPSASCRRPSAVDC